MYKIYSFYQTIDVNECMNDPCHENATCSDMVGSFMCMCDTGFSGDGFNCTGILNFYAEN